MEGDSKVIMSWGNGTSEGPWQLAHFMHEIRNLIVDLKLSLKHIPGEQNEEVDKLSKWRVNLTNIFKESYMLEC